MAARAEVPRVIEYNGRVVVGGTNFNSTAVTPGFFKCVLLTRDGSTNTIWSTDGTPGNPWGSSLNGSPPNAAVELIPDSESAPYVVNGQFKLRLGDEGATPAVNPSVLSDSSGNVRGDVYLRVWFSPDNTVFQRLQPDVKLTSAPYAIWAGMAETVKDRSITTGKLAPGAVSTSSIADGSVTAANLALDSNSLGRVSAGRMSVSAGNVVISGDAQVAGRMVVNQMQAAGNIVADGGLVLGSSTGAQPGAIRWTGHDFEGYNGSAWLSLTPPASRAVGTNVGIRGMALSPYSGSFSTSNTNWVDVTNLVVTIETSGRPVMVCLIAATNAEAYVMSYRNMDSLDEVHTTFAFARDDAVICSQQLALDGGHADARVIGLPPSSLWFLDLAPPGIHTYQLRVLNPITCSCRVYHSRLVAYEF